MIKKLLWLLLALVFLVAIFSPYFARYIESQHNQVRQPAPYQVDSASAKLHQRLLIADLHADPLLWARDLRQEWQQGHFDLPRMQKANLSLQVFGLVTKSPQGQNFQKNSGDTDRLIPLVMAQHWPIKTWNSPKQRALYQAKRLQNLTKHNDQLRLIKDQKSLAQWLSDRQKDHTIRAGMLGIEGAHALEADLNNFTPLYQAGIRMIGMAHFFDNHFSGSAHGVKQGGLSADGIKLVKLAQEKGALIDIAHTSQQAINDILKISTKPLVVSHTGVKAVCDSPRNLSDRHIRAIAKTGGVMAVAIFEGATCGYEIKEMIDTIDHIVKLVGVDYVAFGLDLDGSITSPVDVTGMPLITQELIKRGYSYSEIAKISGLNFIGVLQQTLPTN
ncbi:dipeptidase [Kangiella sp. TOML190]|uniref:dipeptidase n=1 Tax=Kangiella sp. TOML190 TaxID=2931351 RepID=UPI00203DBB5D|nr:membrane dipeptidase [Kangiella sp. TOML190]